MDLGNLLEQVKNAVSDHATQQPGNYDPNPLLGAIEGLFTQHAASSDRQVLPASQDPYGDPADTSSFGNVRPASEDPYGDPADQR